MCIRDSINIISQTQKALIGINAQGNFDFSYPYYPIAPSGKNLRDARFNEIRFLEFTYVNTETNQAYSTSFGEDDPAGAVIEYENVQDSIVDIPRDPLSPEHTQFLSNLGISISGPNGRIIYGYNTNFCQNFEFVFCDIGFDENELLKLYKDFIILNFASA